MPRRKSALSSLAAVAALACSSTETGGATTDQALPDTSESPTSASPSEGSPTAPVAPGANGGRSADGAGGGTGATAGREPPASGRSDGGVGGLPVGRPSAGASTPAPGSSSGGVSTSGGTPVSAGAGGGLPVGGAEAIGGSQTSGGASGSGGTFAQAGAAAGGAGGTGGAVSFARCPDDTWNLMWGDDFDGAAGSEVDGSKWAYDSGPNWYNGELQYYSTGTGNASLDGNGNLVIEARQESREGRQYTSARLKTEGRQTFTYGRFEGRMKLPYGQGMWPALWMLGGNSWPNDGEIDIMENLGREPSIAHGTIHGPGYSGASGPGASFTLPDGAVFSDDFHTFAVEWEPEEIRWYIDGEQFSTKTPADIGGNRWVFDHPFFIILNLAVGGEWPGNPDETTVFPQRMLIDYVRVCQR